MKPKPVAQVVDQRTNAALRCGVLPPDTAHDPTSLRLVYRVHAAPSPLTLLHPLLCQMLQPLGLCMQHLPEARLHLTLAYHLRQFRDDACPACDSHVGMEAQVVKTFRNYAFPHRRRKRNDWSRRDLAFVEHGPKRRAFQHLLKDRVLSGIEELFHLWISGLPALRGPSMATFQCPRLRMGQVHRHRIRTLIGQVAADPSPQLLRGLPHVYGLTVIVVEGIDPELRVNPSPATSVAFEGPVSSPRIARRTSCGGSESQVTVAPTRHGEAARGSTPRAIAPQGRRRRRRVRRAPGSPWGRRHGIRRRLGA